MKTITLLTHLVQLATLVTATAVAVALPEPLDLDLSSLYQGSTFNKRQQIDLYYLTLCQYANYGGRCARIQGAWESIIQENEDWASSAKADAGGSCVLYANYKCTGNSVVVTSAGIGNLASAGLDNQVSSFRCGQ
ncbi:hypothetical protein BKA65DRAFT_553526 [Rhexocercosporidium sp. MPI-PUGE-AT-0058]|nr:hypothetical protein BKA65DRAFT_553526 [Rhexocercosporidium sp. MPI-PUGE-AT-0058]